MIPEWHRSRENSQLSKTQAACIRFIQDNPVFTKSELEQFVTRRVAVCNPMGALVRLRSRGLVCFEYGYGRYHVYDIDKSIKIDTEERR